MNNTSKILVLTLISFSAYTNASVVISGTRVIYPSNEKEVTIKLTNEGKSPVLVQSWIDKGDIDSKPDNINVPFLLTPPINRINSEKSQTLRLSYTGSNTTLPTDRESIYWLNVLEVPQTKGDVSPNRLQIAFRSRIKLFYRPAGLENDATEAAKSLKWSRDQSQINVRNDSAYYVSLASVTIYHQGKKDTIDGELVAPFSTKGFTVKSFNINQGDKVSYEYINDWGAVKSQDSTL
ncbi:TPA: fimbria/pilus periplasmic chaperone [Raoultella planticola]